MQLITKNNMNKIAVIGGTGKAGKFVIKNLLGKGYKIKMLVRNPQKVEFLNDSIELVNGNVENFEDIHTLLQECDALISTLGQDFMKNPIFFKATENIYKAMTGLNIKRYIMVAGIAINTPSDKKNTKIKITSKLMKLFFSRTINDKQLAFDFLKESNLDWTVVRVPMIKLTDNKDNVKTDLSDCKGSKISSADLAEFMVNQLNEKHYIKKAPFVFN